MSGYHPIDPKSIHHCFIPLPSCQLPNLRWNIPLKNLLFYQWNVKCDKTGIDCNSEFFQQLNLHLYSFLKDSALASRNCSKARFSSSYLCLSTLSSRRNISLIWHWTVVSPQSMSSFVFQESSASILSKLCQLPVNKPD